MGRQQRKLDREDRPDTRKRNIAYFCMVIQIKDHEDSGYEQRAHHADAMRRGFLASHKKITQTHQRCSRGIEYREKRRNDGNEIHKNAGLLLIIGLMKRQPSAIGRRDMCHPFHHCDTAPRCPIHPDFSAGMLTPTRIKPWTGAVSCRIE